MECMTTCVVVTYDGQNRVLPGTPTDNFEWRDVPTVMEAQEAQR
jgi:hypothetical protein